MLSGGSLTNEKAYLMGKFARLALRTRHIDYNGRFCMVSAGSANMKAFGMDRAMTPLAELVDADVIVVVGANLSDAYPVMLPTTINKARQRGARVVAIDPRFGRWVQDDDMKIAIRPGTDGALFLGLLSEVERQGLLDVDFINSRTTGFFDAIVGARQWRPDDVEAVTDVPADTVRELARLIGTADRCMILHARGPEQQTMGTDNVLAMINLALACGHIGKPSSGINMLTGQRNGQGGREWGQRCNQLPAGRSITDHQHRQIVAERWGVEADELPGAGATYVEILQMAGRGEIKGLLSISNNMSVSAPDLTRVDEQMGTLEHVVVIDPFLSESAVRHATVVLPGTTFAEEEGTITTIEGRVVRCDQAVAPVPRRADIDVLRNLARRLGVGHQFDFVRGREVYEEMRMVSAGGPNDYAGHHLGPGPRGRLLAVPRRAPPWHAAPLRRSLRPCRRPGPVQRRRVLTTPARRRRPVPARADDGSAPGPLPVGQPDQADPGPAGEGARPVRGAASADRRSPRVGRAGPGRATEPSGAIDRAVAAERSATHRHGVHAVPLARMQRARRCRPRPDEQDPRLQVHPDQRQPFGNRRTRVDTPA